LAPLAGKLAAEQFNELQRIGLTTLAWNLKGSKIEDLVFEAFQSAGKLTYLTFSQGNGEIFLYT